MINEILNGWKNYFIGSNKTSLKEAKRRANICNDCPHKKYGIHSAILPDMNIKEIKGYYCGDCGCPLSPKVRSMNSKCSKGKWQVDTKN